MTTSTSLALALAACFSLMLHLAARAPVREDFDDPPVRELQPSDASRELRAFMVGIGTGLVAITAAMVWLWRW